MTLRWGYDEQHYKRGNLRVNVEPMAGNVDRCTQLEEEHVTRIERPECEEQTHRGASVA